MGINYTAYAQVILAALLVPGAILFVSFDTLVRYLGLITFFTTGYHILNWLYLTFFRGRNDLSSYRSKKNGVVSWALVTGATDGIGKSFAQELLDRQFSVVLLSRNPDKLKAVRQELLNGVKGGQQVAVIAADAEKATDAVLFTRIASELDTILADSNGALRILVNNVGIEVLEMNRLHNQKPIESNGFERMLNVNALFPTRLTSVLIPYLVPALKNAQTTPSKAIAAENGATAIINVSSYSSMISAPFLSVYAATKSYNNSFSRATALEYREYGLEIVGITPGFVASNMTGTDKVTIERCSSKVCASGALDKLGYAGTKMTSPYWYHSFQEAMTSFVYPTKLMDALIYDTLKANMKYHARKREQKLKEEQEKKAASN